MVWTLLLPVLLYLHYCSYKQKTFKQEDVKRNQPNCFLAATGRKNKFSLRSCDKMQVERHVEFRGSTRGVTVPLSPSKNAQCSRVPTVFPNSLLPCLTFHLTTIPHHQHQQLAIPMFRKTSSFSVVTYVILAFFPCSSKFPGKPSVQVSPWWIQYLLQLSSCRDPQPFAITQLFISYA